MSGEQERRIERHGVTVAPLDISTLGGWLAYLRRRAHWTQVELAEAARLSAETVSHVERGVVRATRGRGRGADGATRALLAQALRARFAELSQARGTDYWLTEDEAAELSGQAGRLLSAAPAATRPDREHGERGGAALPTPLTSFVGRERERAEIAALLARPEARLLTLTGPGGVGKTRLALAVGTEMLDHYPDGVWLVELAPLADPTLLPSTLAGALGLREEANRPLVTTLIDHLTPKRLLLLLDNCEHLLAACADVVSTLLRASPAMRILATSRQALGVSGEQVYRAPSLDVPDPRHLPPLERVSDYAAVRLFVARAQARRQEFALTDRNAPVVVEICRRLDGIPLAIELAAVWVGSLPVTAIAQRLDERFRLLTGGARDVLPRQQTLRATMDWSWELLSVQEQTLLRRLSVFVGGWTLGAAEAVGAGDGSAGWALLDLLAGLVNKSLVELDETGAEARYRLLETVRQYGLERLETAGELVAAREWRLTWCVGLAQAAEAALVGPEQQAWASRLEAEHDNLRAALTWSVQEERRPVSGLRLASALWRFWQMHGHLAEGRRWLERALIAARDAPIATRAAALLGAGHLAHRHGDFEQAEPLYRQSLALFRELEDRQGIAGALNGLGLVAWSLGDYGHAGPVFDESLALYRALGESRGIATVLNNLGCVTRSQGDYRRARALFEEALALQRALGNTLGSALAMSNLGAVVERQGDDEYAALLHRESLALFRELGDTTGIAMALGNLGKPVYLQGDAARAKELLEESLALFQDMDDLQGLSSAMAKLGSLAYLRGEYARARSLHTESLILARRVGEKEGTCRALINLGRALHRCGDDARALSLHREGLVLAREIGDRGELAAGLESVAVVIAARDGAQWATRLLAAAERLRETTGAALEVGERGEHDRAVHAMREALGEQAFLAAWSEGRARPLEEAVALTLEDHAATE